MIAIGNYIGIGRNSGVSWSSYCTPLGWTWELPITIQQKGDIFRVDPDFNLETYANIPVTTTYYVATNGNDGNSGLDAAHPLKKLSTALAKADVDRVFIAAGWYTFDMGVNLINPARSVKIIGVGNVYLTSDAYNYATGWSKVDNHWEATYGSGLSSVIDTLHTDTYGDFKKLVVAASSAAVDATLGSFIITGGKIYIRLSDDRQPDTNVKILYGTSGLAIVKDNLKYYFENLNFYCYYVNTIGNASATGGLKVYMKDCNFMYSGGASDNLNINGVDETILENCKAAHSNGDGFSSAIKNTQITRAIAINCKGYDNGAPTGTEFNGATLHNGCIAVRINCEYHHNRGSNIHDVDNGTMSLNLGVYSHHSEPAGTPLNYYRANFAIGGGISTAKMWCDTCISEDSYRDYVATGSGVILYKKDCTGDASDEEISSGDIQTY